MKCIYIKEYYYILLKMGDNLNIMANVNDPIQSNNIAQTYNVMTDPLNPNLMISRLQNIMQLQMSK